MSADGTDGDDLFFDYCKLQLKHLFFSSFFSSFLMFNFFYRHICLGGNQKEVCAIGMNLRIYP